ncbi:pyridoxal phosphate-dependent decarboxylase family protein [Aspergillus affinis]|uniref:pyridoxal phosphate-dependent decarboxylase family protein n=1 Tax=Aspergillus affinis TaxID=1070780 RepID=UPI0022FEE884|nr:PLP-dependent transferase [Aspergillus affinis]KAI9038294.1 PLP-dependent transferase [Aspergillus affinis]
MDENDPIHQAISTWFLGPHAENMYIFKEHIVTILNELESARQSYAPHDKRAITTNMQYTPEFQSFSMRISEAISSASKILAKHSIPYWSPRYGGHMCSDLSMPALLGYFMAMLYNPNNITPEVSPLTTAVEAEVESQFCQLFGYNVGNGDDGKVPGWGHVTCDGTVANIEAMWVARNLKYYPLTLWLAITEGDLAFVADRFLARTCTGEEKLLKNLDTWELLNLRPETILNFPAQLNRTFGISARFLGTVLTRYSVQKIGTEALDCIFGIENQTQFVLGKTNHYSWEKGGGVLGIGSNNVVGIEVDLKGRVDLEMLQMHLHGCLERKQAIYAVIAIIGSTEVGAVDGLSKILALRSQYQARGLSFLVHADAAWGGYFTTMLPRDDDNLPITSSQASRLKGRSREVPHLMKLSEDTESSLAALQHTDSITVDPHKAGYVPYPAGGVVYRDKRMGNLISSTVPYLAQGSERSIGSNGLQGRPGAAAMSIWLSNYCIGLNGSGYGALLGEVSFNSAKMAAHWAILSSSKDSFICVPFNKVSIERDRIQWDILDRSYEDIMKSNTAKQRDHRTMPLMRKLGSDLNINAFALNWSYSDGSLNTDIEEANELMTRVVQRLSIDSPNADPAEVPFYLTSTEFSVDRYGRCLESYKKRLGLEKSEDNLVVLRNTVMNPFMGRSDCFPTIMREIRAVVQEEVESCRNRNILTTESVDFHIHGTCNEVYLVSRPCFRQANRRQQVIFAATLPSAIQKLHKRAKKSRPSTICSVTGISGISLARIISSFEHDSRAVVNDISFQEPSTPTLAFPRPLTLSHLIAHHSLSRRTQDPIYPDEMPFYLYGRPFDWHISHIMVRAPNIVLNASNIHLWIENNIYVPFAEIKHSLILTFADIHEASRHPFPPLNKDLGPDFFFRPGELFRVNVWKDPGLWGGEDGGVSLMERLRGTRDAKVATGWVQLGEEVFVDVEDVNMDEDEVKRCHDGDDERSWLDEFELMGKN